MSWWHDTAQSLGELWRTTPPTIKTIITAAFGTLIGALLTSRAQEKRRVVEMLKAHHAAYNLCFSVINRAMALKRQHVRPMKERHDRAAMAFALHRRGELKIGMDLQTISPLTFPGNLLEKIVFEKCDVGARGLACVVTITGAIADLQNSIDLRNELINEFRTSHQDKPELEKIQLYVGAPKPGGVDQRFPHNIEALSRQVDDCIFFSMLLADELLKSGNSLRNKSRFKFRLPVRKLLPVDWTKAREAGLIPNEDDYADWLSGFQRPPTMFQQLASRLRWVIDALRMRPRRLMK